MRINLLPPEILERRQAEQRIKYVVFAALGVAALLAIVWMVTYARVQGKEGDLAALQQEVEMANAQAAQLAIFEERAAELEARRTTVQQALGDRIEWARIYDEVSLVLPSDIWLQSMAVNEESGVSLNGYAIDVPGDSPDAGHKAIAKALVRLADLEAFYDVWLTNSSKATFEDQPAIQFSISTQVVTPEAAGTAAVAGTGGQ